MQWSRMPRGPPFDMTLGSRGGNLRELSAGLDGDRGRGRAAWGHRWGPGPEPRALPPGAPASRPGRGPASASCPREETRSSAPHRGPQALLPSRPRAKGV